jgi:hypothetical protein
VQPRIAPILTFIRPPAPPAIPRAPERREVRPLAAAAAIAALLAPLTAPPARTAQIAAFASRAEPASVRLPRSQATAESADVVRRDRPLNDGEQRRNRLEGHRDRLTVINNINAFDTRDALGQARSIFGPLRGVAEAELDRINF